MSSERADLSNPIYNWLSIFGCILAVGSLTSIVFFVLVGLFADGESSYGGLAFLPPVAIALLGVGMILYGFVREVRRQKRGRHSSFHRKWVVEPSSLIRGVSPWAIGSGIVIGTLVVLGGGAGSLMLVDFTESNTFCGDVCHQVMRPEAMAHGYSPHSEVACVECHVGSERTSYIESKLNGMRQLYALATDDIRRPIPTPIHGLLDSSNMCESCHTQDRLTEYKVASHSYFLSDEATERVKLRMLLNVGGEAGGLIEGAGIHSHMMVARKMEFIARDPQRQDIAWVRVTESDGEVREYSNEDDPLTDEERETLEVRAIECLDCHSRPAHRFKSPVDSVDSAITAGRISAKIPYVKQASVIALDGGYESTQEALANIGERFRSFYEEEHPDALDGDSRQVNATVAELQKIYERTIFPEMKTNWSVHPNNIGHRDSLGCFRCHNDAMLDEEGEAISADCNVCHIILTQGEGAIDTKAGFDTGLEFLHPEDWETFDEFTLCSDCHTGGADVYE